MACTMKRTLPAFILVLLIAGCATGPVQPKTFNATLEVDFGPANKPPVRRVIRVEQGVTPEGLVSKTFAVERGAICCDKRETAAIDGVVANPAANRWWSVSVNGSKDVSPFKTRLKPGDLVRWEYRQNEQ